MEVLSYLIEAHIIYLNEDNLDFLLLKRAENEVYAGVWQMVTGSVEPGEKGFQTALREVKEETGLSPTEFYVVPHMNSFYSPAKDHVCMVPVFAVVVKNKNVKLSEEHSEYRWVDKEDAKRLLAWQGQRKSVDTIYEYFTNERSLLKFVKIDI